MQIRKAERDGRTEETREGGKAQRGGRPLGGRGSFLKYAAPRVASGEPVCGPTRRPALNRVH